jgi:hypothetical protein
LPSSPMPLQFLKASLPTTSARSVAEGAPPSPASLTARPCLDFFRSRSLCRGNFTWKWKRRASA